jgi:predicted AAA+ superfamily ATPase
MIHRSIESILQKYLHKRRAIVIYGARRTGKTTILNKIAESLSNYRLINCDLIDGQEAFNFHNLDELRIAFGGYDHILIDEAQRVPEYRHQAESHYRCLPETQIYVTGSSALDLSNLTNEPLTGRNFEFITAPLSTAEIHAHDGAPAVYGQSSAQDDLWQLSEVYLEKTMPEEIIKEIAGSYLFRDILVYQDVKRPDL